MRLVDQVHIAHGDRFQYGSAQTRSVSPSIGLFHCLPLNRDLEDRHLHALFIHIAVEPAGNESVAVRVDQIARYILA